MLIKSLEYCGNACAIILSEKKQKVMLHVYYVLRYITTRFKTHIQMAVNQMLAVVHFPPPPRLLYVSQSFPESIC